MKKSLVMLAHEFVAGKHNLEGWYWSEKMDGMRAWWDGGITRGLPASEVPWANCLKHSRFQNEVIATGLWTRYGQPIQAPDWWLDGLPDFCCDGELWMGPKTFQQTVSIVKRLDKSGEWNKINYMVFDVPSIFDLFADRVINETNIKVTMRGCVDWVTNLVVKSDRDLAEYTHMSWTFEQTQHSTQVGRLNAQEFYKSKVFWVPQEKLGATWEARLKDAGDSLAAENAEGIIVRHPGTIWTPERSHDLLKVKRRYDAEAEVIGYIWGRKTNKGSKLLGLMGALIVRDGLGNVFELSGFTDFERILVSDSKTQDEVFKIGEAKAGKVVDDPTVYSREFKIGSKVTYSYRELSDAGIPKEAAYSRISEHG